MSDLLWAVGLVSGAIGWAIGCFLSGHQRSIGRVGSIADLPPGTYYTTSTPPPGEEAYYYVRSESGGYFAVYEPDGMPPGRWQRSWNLNRGWHARPLSVEVEPV